MSIHAAMLLAMGSAQPVADPPAQRTPPLTAERAIERARSAYGPEPPEPELPADCDEPEGDEIVVCARLEEQSQFRVPSSLDQGSEAHLEWAGEAPNTAGPGIFTGPPTVSGCIKGISCPPTMPELIDLDAIPEAPKGSDAARVGDGSLRLD